MGYYDNKTHTFLVIYLYDFIGATETREKKVTAETAADAIKAVEGSEDFGVKTILNVQQLD